MWQNAVILRMGMTSEQFFSHRPVILITGGCTQFSGSKRIAKIPNTSKSTNSGITKYHSQGIAGYYQTPRRGQSGESPNTTCGAKSDITRYSRTRLASFKRGELSQGILLWVGAVCWSAMMPINHTDRLNSLLWPKGAFLGLIIKFFGLTIFICLKNCFL